MLTRSSILRKGLCDSLEFQYYHNYLRLLNTYYNSAYYSQCTERLPQDFRGETWAVVPFELLRVSGASAFASPQIFALVV